jgi:hypothetical protein
VQVLENAAAVAVLGGYFASTAALGSDQTTLWLGGLGSGSPAALNPWSPTTTNVPAGASYLIGARDNGTSFGPWTTSSTMPGQAGSFFSLIPTPANDLIVYAGGGGLGAVISLNGRTIVGSQDILGIFKFATATGTVVWKTGLPNGPVSFIAVAPDGSTVAVTPQTATNYGFVTYADADGSIPGSFIGQGGADAIAVGGNSLYVLGRVRATTNFNPGTKATDIQGNLPGIFITRFAY